MTDGEKMIWSVAFVAAFNTHVHGAGARTAVRPAVKAQTEDRAIEHTRNIVDAVAQVFQHVIDPKAGAAATQAALNATHNAHLLPGAKPAMRC